MACPLKGCLGDSYRNAEKLVYTISQRLAMQKFSLGPMARIYN